jgi:hypothetical protein
MTSQDVDDHSKQQETRPSNMKRAVNIVNVFLGQCGKFNEVVEADERTNVSHELFLTGAYNF